MSIHRHNEYLDAGSPSDNESLGYDSGQEAQADSRTAGLTRHRSKRPKLSPTLSDEGEDQDQAEIEADDNSLTKRLPVKEKPATAPTKSAIRKEDSAAAIPPDAPDSARPSSTTTTTTSRKSKPSKPLKPGVIYLSRIPPYMPPHLVRTHLSAHGPLTNLFLTPEPPSHRALRLKHNGNKKRIYTDGWIEFASHKHARACVDAINGRTVGGKKGGWFRDDVWNAKYLRGFTWGDLMEGVRREEREREEKVRVGVARDKREREAFLGGVEASKIEGTRKEKRARREKATNSNTQDDGMADEEQAGGKVKQAAPSVKPHEQRLFCQNHTIVNQKSQTTERPDDVNRVLSKIF